MNNKKLSNIIKDIIERKSSKYNPMFYTIVGSKMFGIEKNGSDYDIRGFHITPIEDYGKLTQPQERIKHTESYNFEEVEFISYELRTFCSHILKGDFNVVEMLFLDSDYVIIKECDIDSLRKIIKSYLPMNLPEKYMGMAKSHYHRYVKNNDFKPKRYLHLIRGVLSTKHLLKNNELNPSMEFLVENELDGRKQKLVKKLIDVRKNNLVYTKNFVGNIDELIEQLMLLDFNDINYDRNSLEMDLNDWMFDIRNEYGDI